MEQHHEEVIRRQKTIDSGTSLKVTVVVQGRNNKALNSDYEENLDLTDTSEGERAGLWDWSLARKKKR